MGPPLLPTLFPGRREMGEEHVTLRRGGGRREKKVDGQAEREVRCQCVCPQAM